MSEELKKILDAIETLVKISNPRVLTEKIRIGAVVQFICDKSYNIYSIVTNVSANGTVAFTDVMVTKNKIEISNKDAYGTKMDDFIAKKENAEIVSSDAVEWVDKIISFNPKKAALEGKIKDLETKIKEMKSEVEGM